MEPRRVELSSAVAMNAGRVPDGVELKVTNISEREALFLQENDEIQHKSSSKAALQSFFSLWSYLKRHKTT